MATSFIIAVTAHREVGGMGQRREQHQQPVVAGLFHLRPITAFELSPCRLATIGPLELCDRFSAWGEVGKPEVIEVAASVLRLWYPSRRPTDGPEAKAFAWQSRTA